MRFLSADEVRSNGLQLPWHYLQLSAWLLYISLLIYYFFFIMPLLWNGFHFIFPVTLAFCISAASTLISSLLVSGTNAADPAVLKQTVDPTDRVLCYICDVKVHSSSRHCRACNKCVDRFDHHCKWLNTCVGRSNYKYFLVSILSVSIETSLLLVLTILYIAEAFNGFGDISTRAQEAFNSSEGGMIGVKIILILAAAVLLPFVGLVLQLAGFHAMLLWNGITTYDFIVAESRRQKEKQLELKKAKATNSSQNKAAHNKTIPSENQESAKQVMDTTLCTCVLLLYFFFCRLDS